MTVSREFCEYLEDLFAAVPGSTIRRMFGGAGVFSRGLMYALATSDGRVALKADDSTTPQFEAENSSEWVYRDAKGGEKSMGYWYVPERLFDESEEFADWAQAAFEVAKRADSRKPPAQRKLK